jgi:hypothetical protein
LMGLGCRNNGVVVGNCCIYLLADVQR